MNEKYDYAKCLRNATAWMSVRVPFEPAILREAAKEQDGRYMKMIIFQIDEREVYLPVRHIDRMKEILGDMLAVRIRFGYMSPEVYATMG